MQNKTIVNGEYLFELLNELNKKCKKIEDIKNDMLLPTLKEYGITNNNLSQTTKINNIKTQIVEIEKDLKLLKHRLENSVIPGYQETSQTIKKAFNIDFHDEMDKFISIINKQ